MDSWLVMAYSYASTHPVVLEANGRVTHTHKTHTARIDQMTISLAVSSPRRHRHNPPSTAGTPRHLEGPVFVGKADGSDTPSTAPSPSAPVPDVVVSIEGEGRSLDSASDAADLITRLLATPNLTELKLKGNTLSKEVFRAIVDALLVTEKSGKTTLQIIDSSDCFTRRGPDDIHTAMRCLGEVFESATLREINLSDNALSLEGAKILSPQVARCTSLTVLRLNNTGLGPLGGMLVGLGLAEGARRGLRLKVLQLGRSRQESKGAAAIAEAFELMKSLEEILLPQNGIKDTGIVALATAVRANPNLRVLDLNDNTFRTAGSKAMAKSLSEIHEIEEVNFGDCLLKSAGFEMIANALTNNHPHLKRVDLTYNEIGRSNVSALCQLVAGKTKLEKLELNGNILSDEDLEQVTASLCVNDVDDVLGETDEMEDPDDEEEDDAEEDDASDSDDDGSDEADEAEGEAAIVAETLNQLRCDV
eukprot:m.63156 g.63156  ORF g.63156 m.63156 type:complete len:476 (-) comp9650_c0_seq4:1011-2438(-)